MITVSSEPLPDSGGHIEGAVTLSSHLGLASLLVRETVQNSWDAQDHNRPAGVPVEWRADGRTASGSELDVLRRFLPVGDLGGFDRGRDDGSVGLRHPADVLDATRTSAQVLIISDRWTVGLSGPTRAGVDWKPVRSGRPWPDGVQRFAYFIRNTGRPRAAVGEGDGGSYGIGKSVLWRSSLCGTILVHSRTTDEDGDPVDRVIGAVHGADFTEEGRQYTGRHFAGRLSGTAGRHLIEPVTGAEARRFAIDMQLPDYPDGSFGTSVVILAPRFAGSGPAAMSRIRDAARWQVWPKFTRGIRDADGPSDMAVAVSWQGADLDIPDPDDDPELQPYVHALRHAAAGRALSPREDRPASDHRIECGSPRKQLGWLRIRKAITENAYHVTDDVTGTEDPDDPEQDVASPAPFDAGPHGHVALIRRKPLLLVKYLDLPDEIAGEHGAHAGVFLSADDEEVERALTAAEPPAHDDWRHQQVRAETAGKYGSRYAKLTVARINEALRSLRTGVGSEAQAGDTQAASAQISRGLLGAGWGGGRNDEGGGGSGSGGSADLRAVVEHRSTVSRRSSTDHELLVTVEGGTGPVVLLASAVGRDSQGRMDISDIVEFSWVGPDGEVDGPVLRLDDPGEEADLRLSVTQPITVLPRVRVEEVSDGG